MRGLALLGIIIAALALPLSPQALAHDHPSGISDLVTPAVVRIEATSQVKIALVDSPDLAARVERSYDVPNGSGSGIVVTPDGAIVTLSEVVKSERNLTVYAVNKLFAEHYNLDIPDDFSKHSVTNGRLNRQLQQCYSAKRGSTPCDRDISTTVTVFRNTLPPDTEGFSASVVQAAAPGSPAILMASGLAVVGELPTAPLATQVPGQEGAAVNIAGLLGRPAADTGDHVDIAHLGKPGTAEVGRGFADPQKKIDEPSKLGALTDQGLRGGPVIGDKDGHVIGLLAGGGQDARMIGVREITAALQSARTTPRRGAVDAAFEAALTRFHTHYYGQAVPGFQRVLALSPGHVMAAKHLKTSLAKRDGPEDKGSIAPKAEGTIMSMWLIIAAAVLIIVTLGGALLLWTRRSTSSGSAPATPTPDETASSVTVRHPRTPSPPPYEQAQPSVRYCTACGMQMEQGHRFCAYCGRAASI